MIDLSKTVFEICNNDPEVIGILNELGFTDITRPSMLNTAGRWMTIPKGADLKKIGLDKIIAAFQAHNYQIKSEEV